MVGLSRSVRVSSVRFWRSCFCMRTSRSVASGLIDELWGAHPPATVSRALRVRVAELRRLLEPDRRSGAASDVIVSTDGRLVVNVAAEALDVLRFEALVEEAEGASAAGDDESAAELLRSGLALWRGPALEDFTYEPFAQPAIARLEELRATSLERRIDADLALGRHERLVPELEELIAREPHREHLRAQLMLALYRSARQSDALDAYQDARRELADVLGIEPSRELKELEQAILRQEPVLQPGRGVSDRPEQRTKLRNPYKGLRPFGAADAGDFFGRDDLVGEVLGRLEAGARFVCVVGASGSGKSSLVRAGVVPRLGADTAGSPGVFRTIEIVPGADPLVEIEAALLGVARQPAENLIEQLEGDPHGLRRAAARLLPDDGSELLVVIDQFEELFTMVDDESLRQHVLESIRLAVTHPRSRVRVIATLRADFYDRPLAYRDFGRLVEDNTLTVLPLSTEELERAITRPAAAVGAVVDQALVTEIVADVNHQPGALPLVQYAMTELFERRETDVLTVEGYRAVGGVSGAIAARAERLYGNLDPDEQEATRRLFSRLVTFGEGSEDTRRRVPRSEVEPLGLGDQITGVINAYTTHRFLSTDRDPTTQDATVEIAHEALLREWPRLRAWIDEDRDGLRLLRHVSESATAWERLNREPGELYRGSRLEDALAWRTDHPGDLNPLEGEFLDASRQLRDAEQHAAQERVRHRLKQNRRLRVALGVVALALVGAIVGAVVALDQRGTAKEQTDRAEVETARASDEAERATAEAARADEEAERANEEAERATAEASRAEEEAVRAETARAEEANASSEAETARFEAETGRLVAEAAARVDDNRRLALLLAAETHRRAPSLETLGALQRVLVPHGSFQGYLGSGGAYVELEFSTDGERLIALGNGTIEVYDVATRTLIDGFDIEEAIDSSPISTERAASLGQGGEEAVVATASGEVVVYSTADGSAVVTIRPDGEPVTEVAVAPNGGPVGVGHEDGMVSVWTRDGTGQPVRFKAKRGQGHRDRLQSRRRAPRDGHVRRGFP